MSLYNSLAKSKIFSKTAVAFYRAYVWLMVTTRLCRLPRPCGKRTKEIIKENSLINLSLENGSLSTNKRLINDQHGATGVSFHFGRRRASYNGCEAIAIHNALTLLGRSSTLGGVIINIQKSGAMWRLGEWGSDPCRLGCVLKRRYGIKTTHFFSPKKLLKDGVYIISYWNTPDRLYDGLHTVALSCENGALRVFNCGRSAFKESRFETNWLPRRFADGFIIGYRCQG